MSTSHPSPSRPRGITLVELLVVLAIMSILVTAALAMMRPLMRDVQVREAARMVNTFIAGAQARAVELDRPVGVYIERLQGEPRASLQLFMAEMPPPYAGDAVEARAEVNGATATATFPDGLSASLPFLCNENDFIKFDYKGHMYRITALSENSVQFEIRDDRPAPPNSIVPYQVFRKPVKSSFAPIDLPTGMAIDITASGIGLDGQFPAMVPDPDPEPDPDADTAEAPPPPPPIIITFTPGGQVGYVYDGNSPSRPTASIHLLVGRIDKVGGENTADLSNRWVSIGIQSGLVTTAENAGNAEGSNPRKHALEKQTTGGR